MGNQFKQQNQTQMLRNTLRSIRTFSTAQKNRVGVFGLGNMGLPMALNLQKAGFEVKAYDISPESLERAAAAGITNVSDCYKSTAQDVEYIVTALPVTAHVDETPHREGGIFEVANKGTFICDASTISPDASVRFGATAKENGMTFLDTPMSGGINGAIGGVLTFMVGGTEDDMKSVTPMLKGMGKNIFHCGPTGTGGVAKLTNNLILGISMVATAEAMALGEKLGADPKVLTAIWAVSSARCHSVDVSSPTSPPATTTTVDSVSRSCVRISDSPWMPPRSPTPSPVLPRTLSNTMTRSSSRDMPRRISPSCTNT